MSMSAPERSWQATRRGVGAIVCVCVCACGTESTRQRHAPPRQACVTRTTISIQIRSKDGVGLPGTSGEGAARVLGKAAKAVVHQEPVGLAIVALKDVEGCATLSRSDHGTHKRCGEAPVGLCAGQEAPVEGLRMRRLAMRSFARVCVRRVWRDGVHTHRHRHSRRLQRWCG